MTAAEFLAFHRPYPRLSRRRARKRRRAYRRADPSRRACCTSRSRPCRRASAAASGWRRRCCTIPPVLVLDEPTDGLDPNQKHEMRAHHPGDAARRRRSSSRPISSKRSRRYAAARSSSRAAGSWPTRTPAGTGGALALSQRGADRVLGATEIAAELRTCRRCSRAALAPVAGDRRGRAGSATTRRRPRLIALPARAAARDVIRRQSPIRDPHATAGRCSDTAGRARPARRRVPCQDSPRRRCAIEPRRAMPAPEEIPCAVPSRSSAASSPSYFTTPLAYVFIVIFLVLAGVLTFFVGDFFERGQADLQSFFTLPSVALSGADPGAVDAAVGRGAQERHDRIVPDPAGAASARRCSASFSPPGSLPGIALALTFPFWITVNFLGEPDNGVILASYLGSWLMAGAILAIGAAVSARPRTRSSPLW